MNLAQQIESEFLSERIKNVPRSFIRDILGVALSPGVISFAGGLPNKKFFPVKQLAESAQRVLTSSNSGSALQYSSTQGFLKLRESISEYYFKNGMSIHTDNILITTGSQQALDLLGKVLINEGDRIIIEEPSYLGAIQAFSMYRPEFIPVELTNSGLNTEKFAKAIDASKAKLAYLIPNFQNPTGISYADEVREQVTDIAIAKNILLIEDDPYGEIRFKGAGKLTLRSLAPENVVLLGTFSKTVAPGLRIGWLVAPDFLMEKLIVAKQASDLHTDIFSQQIVTDYLQNNEIEGHLNKIREVYGEQAETLLSSIRKYFPQNIDCTEPEGGMFLWVTMPEDYSTMQLFQRALEVNVAFVPGVPFYINRKDSHTMRLNFSCSESEIIKEGVERLASCI